MVVGLVTARAHVCNVSCDLDHLKSISPPGWKGYQADTYVLIKAYRLACLRTFVNSFAALVDSWQHDQRSLDGIGRHV